jgi:hypothetical protein
VVLQNGFAANVLKAGVVSPKQYAIFSNVRVNQGLFASQLVILRQRAQIDIVTSVRFAMLNIQLGLLVILNAIIRFILIR